jgi:hypothetical protein
MILPLGAVAGNRVSLVLGCLAAVASSGSSNA